MISGSSIASSKQISIQAVAICLLLVLAVVTIAFYGFENFKKGEKSVDYLEQYQTAPSGPYFELNTADNNPTVSQNSSFTINLVTGSSYTDQADLYITYDPARIRVDSVTYGNVFTNYINPVSGEGILRISGYFGSDPTASFRGTGLLATVNYTPIATGNGLVSVVCQNSITTESNISFQGVDLIDCSANTGLNFDIIPAPTPTPTIAPTALPTILPTILPTVGPTVPPTTIPTVPPTVPPTIAPTPTPTPFHTIVVKTKLQGVDPNNPDIAPRLSTISVDAAFTLTDTLTRRVDYVGTITLSPDNQGVFTSNPITLALDTNHYFNARLKGPKHIRIIYSDVQIVNDELDLTTRELPVGDVPWKDGVQDGVADLEDLQEITNRLFSDTDPDKIIADLNYDGIVNTFDRSMLLGTLNSRPDDI